MKLFTNKGFIQKMIIVLVIILLFNFTIPNVSSAFGGDLFSPIRELVLGIGDAALWVIHTAFNGSGDIFVTLEGGGGFGNSLSSYISAGVGWVGGAICALNPVDIALKVTGNGDKALSNECFNFASFCVDQSELPEDLDLPLFTISPQEIFEGKIPALSVDFFGVTSSYNSNSIASQLSEVIAKWYGSLRTLAIVGMMSILIYIGIRIIISSTGSGKAKYKEMLMDWVVALCLLFVMHYIMVFAVYINQKIVDMVSSEAYMTEVKLTGLDKYEGYKEFAASQGTGTSGELSWPTNLMGKARIDAQLENPNDENSTEMRRFSYTLIYIVLIVYTIGFLIIYLKRVIYMAFLTMIAPLVALTYPLDKLGDGKAQAFKSWLTQYIYNLLIQPFHLILYVVLVGSAMDFAQTNIIYAIVAIGFLFPAEKLIKKMFNLDRGVGGITDASGAALGGAAALWGVNKLTGLMGKGKKGGSSGGSKGSGKDGGKGGSSDEADAKQVRVNDKYDDDMASAFEDFKGSSAEEDEKQNQELDPKKKAAKERYDEMKADYASDEELAQFAKENGLSDADINAKMKFDNEDPVKKAAQERYDEMKADGASASELARFASDNGLSIDLGSEAGDAKTSRFAGAKSMAGSFKRKVKENAKPIAGKAARIALKTGAKVIGAGTLGTIGLAAGIANGKPGDAWKYAAAGAAGGAMIGNKVADLPSAAYRKVSSAGSSIKASYEKNKYGEEEYKKIVKDRDAKKDKEEFLNDSKTIKEYQKHFGNDYEDKMETAYNYRKSGVKDNEAIIKAMQVDSGADFGAEDSKKRIALAKLYSQVQEKNDLGTVTKKLKNSGVKDEAAINDIKDKIKKMKSWE